MLNLLFVCTHNRCRSILSEAITNSLGGERLRAASAGSQPADEVHPLTLRYLQRAGISTEGLHSKSWQSLDSFRPDVVITVCDRAANEACPLWLGNAAKLHWVLADPSSLAASDEAIERAFEETIAAIRRRTKALLAAELDTLDPVARLQALQALASQQPC